MSENNSAAAMLEQYYTNHRIESQPHPAEVVENEFRSPTVADEKKEKRRKLIKIASNIKGKFKRDRVLGDVTNVEGTPASSRSASPESNKRKASVSLAPSISPSASPASKGGIPYSVQPLLQALSGDIKTKKALKKEILLLAERNQAMEEMQVQWTQDLHDAQEDFGRATNTAKATEAELEKVKAELAQIKQRNTALENELKEAKKELASYGRKEMANIVSAMFDS